MRLAHVMLGLSLGYVVAQYTASQPRSVVMYVMRVRPEPEWVRIYHEVEDCANRKGQVESVKWYVMDGPVQGEFGGKSFGVWRIRDDGYRQIIVIRGDTATVRHEILHDVLWESGVRPEGDTLAPEAYHPAAWFGRCAVREAE